MNSIKELEIQNLQDSWSILYLSMARVYLERNSEDGLRKIIRSYGREIGRRELTTHMEKGMRNNLKNYFLHPSNRVCDPRFVWEKQRLNEQVALFNVIRCPFAMLSRLRREDETGKIFCEEYCAAAIGEYTKNAGQTNISEVLTEPENSHCRLAVYYRPANVSKEQAGQSFTCREETKAAEETDRTENGIINPENIKDVWQLSAALLLKIFEDGNEDEDSRVACIQYAAGEIADFMKKRAVSMEKKLDAEFIDRNCAIGRSEGVTDVFRKELEKRLGF